MATRNDNHLSAIVFSSEIAKSIKIGIVVAEWNSDITQKLYAAAFDTLLAYGIPENSILKIEVPGSFELVAGAQLLENTFNPSAIICLGCVIQGETRHFDFICSAVAHGLTDLGIKYNKPIIFGVLTTNTLEQAQDRAGGNLGNKGDEAAITALKMVLLTESLKSM